MPKIKTAILVSNAAAGLKQIIDEFCVEDSLTEISLVVSNLKDTYGLTRAEKAGIPTLYLPVNENEEPEVFEQALDEKLREAEIELICLDGFSITFTDWFITKWNNKIIKTHPSLLPAFKGTYTHERVIESGVKFTGCTIHFVRTELDDGPIIMQGVVPVCNDDDQFSLADKVLEAQNVILPLSIKAIAEKKIHISANSVRIDGAECENTILLNPQIPETASTNVKDKPE
ncbi:MAG: phosphoribosylglycinamide formyltransferase [Alphaproteobacteria bacterium]|nr:phosphoribosylglycinamide formyltransferase [Alphaproteobacteria bacterium]